VLDTDGIRRLTDLVKEGQRFVAAQGGNGGRGNARFRSARQRAPTRCEEGQPGEVRTLRLELKLLADVGLLGFPNAGKSTLISRISAARPKIADYPFTTLEPGLGTVDRGDFRSFVVADIPGLIEGAHHGAGLGLRFLRHIERCRLLLHLIDPTDPSRDPVQGIEALNHELASFRPEIAKRPQILVLTKADATQERKGVEAVERYAAEHDRTCLTISSVTGEGLAGLIQEVGRRLDELPAREPEP
jgi:GTP-binding protein